jgi:hypothetical protein
MFGNFSAFLGMIRMIGLNIVSLEEIWKIEFWFDIE